MKKVFLFFISLFLLNACSFDTNQDQGKIGQIGAEISAKDTSGKTVKLADDKSNIKVLVFFKMDVLLVCKSYLLWINLCKNTQIKSAFML